MMPKVHPLIWSDPEFEGANPEVKLCVMWLLTNAHKDMAGVMRFTPRRFAFETGLSENVLVETLRIFSKSFISPSEGLQMSFERVVFLKNYIRFQYGSGDRTFDSEKFRKNNISRPVLACIESHCGTWVYDQLREAYPGLFEEDLEALGKPLVSPSQGLVKKKQAQGEGEREREGVQGKGGAGGKPKPPKQPVLPTALNTDAFKSAWVDWEQDRRERKKKLTPKAIEQQLKFLEELGHDDAIKSIRQSIQNQWTGLFPPDHNAKSKTPVSRNQGTFNAEDDKSDGGWSSRTIEF